MNQCSDIMQPSRVELKLFIVATIVLYVLIVGQCCVKKMSEIVLVFVFFLGLVVHTLEALVSETSILVCLYWL